MGAFLNSRRFERRLMTPTCGRFPPRWELAASTASACTRIRTASPHPRATITRWRRHPRSYPRAKCFLRRYFAIILELGGRRVDRPLVSRRIGDARSRPAATSDAELEVSVVPKRVRARPRECAGDRLGLRTASARGVPAVSIRIPHRIWHGRAHALFFSDPRLLSGPHFRTERLHPPHYTTNWPQIYRGA